MDPIQTQIPAQQAWNPYNLVWDATIPVPQVQVPVQQVPMQQVQIPMSPVQQIPLQQAPAAPTEGILEKIVKWIVRFIAKASGNPDPLTGQGWKQATTPQAWTVPVAPQSGWIFGQIGGIFSGMAETAQSMVGGIAWAPQAPSPSVGAI